MLTYDGNGPDPALFGFSSPHPLPHPHTRHPRFLPSHLRNPSRYPYPDVFWSVLIKVVTHVLDVIEYRASGAHASREPDVIVVIAAAAHTRRRFRRDIRCFAAAKAFEAARRFLPFNSLRRVAIFPGSELISVRWFSRIPGLAGK